MIHVRCMLIGLVCPLCTLVLDEWFLCCIPCRLRATVTLRKLRKEAQCQRNRKQPKTSWNSALLLRPIVRSSAEVLKPTVSACQSRRSLSFCFLSFLPGLRARLTWQPPSAQPAAQVIDMCTLLGEAGDCREGCGYLKFVWVLLILLYHHIALIRCIVKEYSTVVKSAAVNISVATAVLSVC